MDSRRHFLGKVSGLAGTFAVAPARVLGANERIRVGVIGVGDRGTELIHQLGACGNVEIAGIADIYSKRREKASAMAPDSGVFADYRFLLDDAAIDAVIIASPPHLHAEQFCAALEAGKHVYVEKTLANSVEQAKRMRDAFQGAGGSAGRVVQVGHQTCSSGQMTDVRQFLAQPARMGKVSSLAMRHYRNTPHGKAQWARPALLTADLLPHNVDWAAFSGENSAARFDAHRFIHWRYFWEYSGGGVTENMSQQLAFWYQALQLEIPISATMTGGNFLWNDGRETPDTMDVALTQPEEMLVSWSAGSGNNQLGISEDLLGSAGTVSRASQVRYIPQKMNRPEGVEMPGRSAHAPHAHMRNFFDSIRLSSQPNCPFELGYRVSIACQMAVESYRQQRTVRWDAAREEIV